MGLTLTVLGCCGSYPGPGQACSGYLVRSATTTLWLDAGPGTLAALQRHVGLCDVDAVVISHEHPDHRSDLDGFYVARKYYVPCGTPIPVFAPASVRATAYYQDPPLEWHAVSDGGSVEVGDLRLTFSRTDHPPETLAVRVDGDGGALAYSGDSGPGWSFEAFGPGLGLALCDATFVDGGPDRSETGHMTARQAGESARRAGVGRLVLTHLEPGADPEAYRAEGSEAIGAPVEVAAPGAEYEL